MCLQLPKACPSAHLEADHLEGTFGLVADDPCLYVGLGRLLRLNDFIIDLVPHTTDIATGLGMNSMPYFPSVQAKGLKL